MPAIWCQVRARSVDIEFLRSRRPVANNFARNCRLQIGSTLDYLLVWRVSNVIDVFSARDKCESDNLPRWASYVSSPLEASRWVRVQLKLSKWKSAYSGHLNNSWIRTTSSRHGWCCHLSATCGSGRFCEGMYSIILSIVFVLGIASRISNELSLAIRAINRDL